MKSTFFLFALLSTSACHNSNNNNDNARGTADTQTTKTEISLLAPGKTDTLPPVECTKTLLLTIENFKVWQLDQGAVIYMAKMAIDADGSPRAYCPGNQGLDYTANAGKPGNWYGVVTDESGEPVIQNATDPFPGCYVSPTTLYNKDLPKSNPLRYCNSEEIPFIVLPKKVLDSGGIRIGDFAFVYNTRNRKSAFAVFADGGPSGKLGEGSVFLAKQLGINSNPRSGGVPDGIIYLVFPHSGKGNGYLPSMEEIDQNASQALQLLGGKSIIDCLDL